MKPTFEQILDTLFFIVLFGFLFICMWIFCGFTTYSNKPIFHDGDTFKIYDSTKNKIITCRLSNIDAPEISQPFGTNSRDSIIKIVNSGLFTYKIINSDFHGRFVVNCFINNCNLDSIIIYNGWAWVYSEYNHDSNLIQLQQKARLKKIGLWKNENPIEPKIWRKKYKKF
jgi:endonuclease YncB( thermonuclease family)